MPSLALPLLRRFVAIPPLLVALVLLASAATSARAQVTTSLYLTNRDGSVVDAISTTGTVSAFYSSGSVLPPSLFGVTLDSAGNLYVAVSTNTSNDRIVKITPGGVASTFYAFGTTTSPTDLAFDGDGNLYVGSQAGRGILKISSGGTLSTYVAQSSLVNRPFGLAFDNDGYLYVSNYGANNIARFDTSGSGSVWATLPASSNPFGIAFDNQGNLLVVRSNANVIDRITPGGTRTTIASVTNGSALTFDAVSGYAYVASQNSYIYKVAPNGSSTTLFATVSGISGGINGMESVNAVVPEPATCAALAGLAALSLACWRRTRRQAA